MTGCDAATKMNRIVCSFCIVLCFLIMPADSFCESKSEKEYLESIVKRLVGDGFEEKQIRALFHRPEVQFETRGISLFSVHREAKLNYDQFLSRANLRKARMYMEKHRDTFQKTEKEYGVEKEIITAIMLVETRLGTYLGGSSTLNILSTMAVLSDPPSRDFIWQNMSKTKEHNRKEFNNWSDRKADWAYTELKALLTYTQQQKIDPVSITGSYAGAIGICQFMPSNVVKLAKDGNQDGNINLFDHADAIASIANFLKAHGWRMGMKRLQQYPVLLKYNYSKPYANTLMDIAQKLKG